MAYSGGAGLPNPTSVPAKPGPSFPRPSGGKGSRPANHPVGAKAGPHGAIFAPSGPKKPPSKPGFSTIGTGRGGWLYKPNAGKSGAGKSKGAGSGKFAGPGVPLNDPILNPDKGLSGQSLYDAASALADAQTKGPLAELAKQIASNNAQTKGAVDLTGGYLNSLGNFAKQGVTDEQGIAGNLNLGLGLIGAGEQQGLQGIQQNAQQQLQQYAPQSGQGTSTVSPAMQSLTQELARQQGLAAQQQGAFKASGATQGANYGSLAAQSLGTDALAGTAALKGIAQAGTIKNEPLNAKIAALDAQRGALLGTDLGKLRQQEIANRFTSQGLGLKQQGLALTAAQDAARNSLTARGQDITAQHNAATEALTANGQNITSARDAANASYQQWKEAHPSGRGSKPGATLSPSLNARVLGEINKSVGMIRQAQASFGKPGGAQRGQVRTLLSAKTGYPAYILDAAFELVGYGALSPSTAAYLHNVLGLRGGGYKVGAGGPGQSPAASAFTG